ncbi:MULTISPECIES: tRNA (guanosine(37)-N1)-methyltransferase TrmD [unclassified Hyphomonas]|jgi:tRNA (guanine37-N1)-methyltransferase|uniref:tRNA (guanine-N(1)-)-methyltransferase n=3 Tax=root TaxID=1 RepID=A0A160U224_9ZZZZ|nr:MULTISPECIES: tRNA (guanosine(37)-N1)-methyltransferase TrmD [unclassified Hyphomonas]MAA81480.1 tRNA (guanosine(37)-N1)-methyltransferase TrmD [Hyphomonas sp.]MAL43845.1 tRNA (guanosine(37)-N1)-methyltransferase TrmD [Hyphomonas sp.]MAX84236.1 tRNA (guanosine(37)-N1)-methyltransferase TrmD [Hyphomonas sp.]QSR20782.1 tRNA (guanosine(37)-N1)-methyltransferase TrmD [Hyphomonas sp. KY3]HBJ41674.1 tRNA (guanosine(37)-N1)-methyltransferase TrmD [Hyphomonas sp.]|tara:strand:- start:1029 stop:1754 length:726 start_codon:yes stop_codon:yes gene_type:complete
MFKASFITLFPEAFPGPLGVSILERARREGIWDYETVQLRDFGLGKHQNVDAPPAGGGAGMVLRPDVTAAALDSIDTDGKPLIYLSPRGEPFSQKLARDLAGGPGMVMMCGRFEGLDERVIRARGLREVSIGDFVLAGGEVAAMAMTEAVVRLLPGVAGNQASLEEESFETGLLEHDQYTLPREWEGRPTPEVLLSGDHKRIQEWRFNSAKSLTIDRRPDLYAAYSDTNELQPPETGDEHD